MQTTDDILFSAHGPDPIPSATTEVVGIPGNALNVYWIVSHFPIGSVVSGPFPQKSAPNVLDDENYVHISWLATLGALSYDLLFTRRLELPKQPGNFALALNLTDTEFRDQGQSLSEYDLAGIRYGAPQQEWIFFDNRDRKQPTLRFIPWPIEVSSIIFEDGSSQNTAGGGQPAPPNQAIQFNDNGAFGGSPNFIFVDNGIYGQSIVLGGNFGIPNLSIRTATANPPYTQIWSQDSPLDISGTGLQPPDGIALTLYGEDGRIWALSTGFLIGNDPQQPNFGRLDVQGNINIQDTQGLGFAYRINGLPLLGISEAPALFVDPQLRVGIGTSNPQAALDVAGANSAAPLLRLAGDNAQPLFTYLTIPDRLSIADVYGAVIIADIRYYAGAIGFINTGMTISVTDATGGSSPKTLNLVGQNTGGVSAQVRISSDNTIRFLTEDVERMRIDSQGNVDITGSLFINGIQVIP